MPMLETKIAWLSKIETRDDALEVVKVASYAFFFLAALQLVLFLAVKSTAAFVVAGALVAGGAARVRRGAQTRQVGGSGSVAVRHAARELRVEAQLGQPLQGAIERLQVARQLVASLLRRGHQLVHADRLVDPERSDAYPSQLAQVGAAAEPGAEIVRQRTQVRPLGAADEDAAVGRLEERHARLVHVHRARHALHLLARSRQLVQALSLDLARRVHRRRLLDEAHEREQRLADPVLGQS